MLSVIICSFLSCGLSVIARQNDMVFSSRKPASTRLASKVSNESSAKGKISSAQALWPWGHVLRGAVERNGTKGSELDGEHDDNNESAKKGSWWQSLKEQVGAGNAGVSHGEVDSMLGRWSERSGEAVRRMVQWGWMQINRWVGVSDAGLDSTRTEGAEEKSLNNMTFKMLRNWSEESVRAGDNALNEGWEGGRGSMSLVQAGLMGIVICALMGIGGLKLLRRRRKENEEAEVRRTVLEERKKNEDVVEKVLRDAIAEIVPEEAV